MLGDGLAVIGGGIALFPWQRPLGLLILQHAGDVNAAFAEPLAAGQTALLLHPGVVLWDQGEGRRALQSRGVGGPASSPGTRNPFLLDVRGSASSKRSVKATIR